MLSPRATCTLLAILSMVAMVLGSQVLAPLVWGAPDWECRPENISMSAQSVGIHQVSYEEYARDMWWAQNSGPPCSVG